MLYLYLCLYLFLFCIHIAVGICFMQIVRVPIPQPITFKRIVIGEHKLLFELRTTTILKFHTVRLLFQKTVRKACHIIDNEKLKNYDFQILVIKQPNTSYSYLKQKNQSFLQFSQLVGALDEKYIYYIQINSLQILPKAISKILQFQT